MNNDKKDLLYQNLPSIKNRISRKERLSLQRNSDCIDCKPDHLIIAKQKSKQLYYFFIALLVICFIAVQIHQRRVDVESFSKEDSKTISVSFTKKITMTIVDQPSRYGISVVFRNTGHQIWNINTIKLNVPNSPDKKDILIKRSLLKDEFYSVFIPLTQKVNKINNITISTTS